MRKLLTFLIALASIVFAVGSPASADGMAIPGVPTIGGNAALSYPPSPPSGPTYTFLGGSDNNVTSGLTETYPVTMTGAAGRLIFATAIATGTISSVVFDPAGANVALVLDYSNAVGSRERFTAPISVRSPGPKISS